MLSAIFYFHLSHLETSWFISQVMWNNTFLWALNHSLSDYYSDLQIKKLFFFQPRTNTNRLNILCCCYCFPSSVVCQYNLFFGCLLLFGNVKKESTQGNVSVVHNHVQFLLLFETCNSSSSGVLQPDRNLRAQNELYLTQDLSASRFLTLSFLSTKPKAR